MTNSREFTAAVQVVRKMPAAALILAAALWLAGCFGERVAVENGETDKASVPGTYFLVKKRLPILDRTGMVLTSSESSDSCSRIYPWNDLALPVLGIVDGFGHGLSGVEHSFDTRLTPGLRSLDDDSADGLYLSLDVRVQQRAERLLSWQMKRLKATAGSSVIMDMETGEILAMANKIADQGPRLKTNSPSPPVSVPNLAIERLLDPWPIPILAALGRELRIAVQTEKESVDIASDQSDGKEAKRPEQNNDDLSPPALAAGKWHWTAIEDAQGAIWSRILDEEFERITLDQGMLPLMIKLGFGQKTGIELPDEALGSLPTSLEPEAVKMAKSQIKATPLQALTAFSRLISGREVIPTILRSKGIEKASQPKSDKKDPATGPSSAQELMIALMADDSGPAVATVRRPPEGSKNNEVISLGFWPAKDPKVAMITVLWETRYDPRLRKGTLGKASDLLKFAGRTLENTRAWAMNRTRDSQEPATEMQKRPNGAADTIGQKTMPDLKGRSLRLAFEEIQALGLTAEIKGSGVVTSQYPAPGARVRPGALCRLIGKGQNGSNGA